MELKDIYTTGSDILGAVTDAIDRNDYSELSSSIEKKVDDLTKEIKREAGWNTERSKASGTGVYQKKKNTYKKEIQAVAPYFKHKVSRLEGIGKMITGIVCTTTAGILFLVFLLVGGLVGIAAMLNASFVFGALTVFSVFLLGSGVRRKNLVRRYFEYGKMIGYKEYIEIEKLTYETGKTKDYLLKDFVKMQKVGMLPQARLDKKNTTLILTQAAYDQYMVAERELETREHLEKASASVFSNQQEETGEVRQLLMDGDSYLNTIRRCNDLIPGTLMSEKIYELEKIMKRIFEQVKKQPESANNLHKFMNYYLPTTTKLLVAYVDLDKQSDTLENIAKTKKEIEDSMDMINNAFRKLLDSMFQDMAWDISSDLSVMKTMMAQDGLTR